ncbi:hypothetical protein [Umezawaea tangerina]|uniref:hypothetical protein n=1 Tax=Umezawaea tangerina TaxID=84725 RepID=UPI0011B289AB|nr:hypothetical protein [Umezawaea tangerina]
MASALVGTAAIALGTVGVAEAAAPLAPCTASDLDITAHQHPWPPNDQDQLFYLAFDAKPGTACTMRSMIGDLVFHDASGTRLGISVAYPNPGDEKPVVMAPGRQKVAYIASKKGTGQGYPVAFATFTLLSAESDRAVSVAWPAPLTGGPARLGHVGDAVS